MPTYFKVWVYVQKRCSQRCYVFVCLTKAGAVVTSLDLWGIELALTLLFWASEYLLVCHSLISWRKYIHTHNETSSIIEFLFNCRGWAAKITWEATENVRQVHLLRLKGGIWLQPSWIHLELLKYAFRKSYWKMLWEFLFWFGFALGAASIWNFKSFGCYFWAKIFSYKFHSEGVEMKRKLAPKLFY